MRRIVCAFICVVLATMLIGCGGSENNKKNESSVTTKHSDYLRSYKEILDKYKESCETSEESDYENKQELSIGLMEMAQEKDLPHKVGYKLIDLNNDGEDELLISSIEKKGYYNYIISIYQHIDGKGVKKVEDGWARNRYYLLKGKVLLNEASGGAFHTEVSKLKMKGQKLKTIAMATVDCEYPKNENEAGKPFFLYNSKGKTSKKKEYYITKKEWSNITSEWENEKDKVEFISFADYK